jgi:hypothetical protein
MKRSDLFIKLTTVVLFLAVASYIGVNIYNTVMNTYEIATAISYSVEETFPAQGYIIRTEVVLTNIGEAVLPIVGEGEKVASGQIIAVEYMNREALETASELHELRLRIAQLEAPGTDAAATEAISLGSVMELSSAVQSGNLSRLDELSLKIENHIFAGGAAREAELPALRARRDLLEGRSGGVRSISAPVSGIFSQAVDGFERIGPGALNNIAPSGLAELFATQYRAPGAGKLVTEFKWYYAAVMDAADAMRLAEGQQVYVQFSGIYHAGEVMLVENIGRREDGKCVVRFSSDRGIHDVAPLRQLRAEVVFGVVSGIRVPKESIHLDDDGTTFIYLQTGVRAERVNVDILLEIGDGYLLRDGTEAGTPLRAGATIIVKANNLYHGKIVA